MAITRKSMREIRASRPRFDRSKLAATTEADIRRQMIEDGEDPARRLKIEEVFSPAAIRRRLGMTQAQFAAALRLPVATLRNWEQGRSRIDPAGRSLLILVARNPKQALAALAAEAA
ncbi:MAG: helix-turn-helix domain-containing protein [Alphaproteobacteria bacterium]|nr:helix-turn-helix domain-containing protein [Alphaproteobacteria bacterium]